LTKINSLFGVAQESKQLLSPRLGGSHPTHPNNIMHTPKDEHAAGKFVSCTIASS